MSGNPTGSNVVPMSHAAAPATAPPQQPMPFPMWGGGGNLPWGPGCCPPGGMDALMKCYCDVQAATAFICSVMVQCVQTNPAVTAAIIAAIEASGSTLPLLGVTNGSNAQPGQVGEYMSFSQQVQVATTETTTPVSMGVLTPGDWDYWFSVTFSSTIDIASFQISPLPAGFSDPCYTVFFGNPSAGVTLASTTARASITVPTLVVISATTQGTVAGPCTVDFNARRMR